MDFFKKLFKIEPEEVTLKHIELKDWLEEISEEALSDDNEELKKLLSEIKSFKIELKEKLEILEKGELMNPDIPEREKHIMLGNRQNYLTKLYIFLADTKIPEFDYSLIDSFCTNFNEKLNVLGQETGKGYFILTHFFDKEVKEIASIIKRIKENVLKIASIMKKGKISEYRAMFANIRELNEDALEKEKLAEGIDILENEIQQNEAKKTTLEQKMSSLKDGHDYQMHNKIEKEKKEIDEELSKLNFKLNNSIKPLDKALKKQMHESLKKELISAYLDNPLLALENDSHYELLGVLEHLKQKIEMGTIEIKDKQKDKMIQQIDELNKDYFESIRKEYDRLKKEKSMMENIIEKSTIVMDYKELQYQHEHIAEKLKKLQNELSLKKENFSSLKVEDKSKKIEKALSEFTGMNVMIKE